MAVMTILESTAVCGGVDTHLDVHVAAAVDPNGGLLGVEEFEVSRAGYEKLLGWLTSFGAVTRVGVEGTGSYGAELARFLAGAGMEVVEVDRPDRQARHRQGKSDAVDAIAAAQSALSGKAKGKPKGRNGNVEAIRVLNVARRSARNHRIATLCQIRHLAFCAPDELRVQLTGLSTRQVVAKAAGLRPATSTDPVLKMTKRALRELGGRVKNLEAEIERLNAEVEALVQATAPELLTLFGVGPHAASLLLVAAGDNSGRIRNEAAWAHLCGVAPIPASSGKVTRYRLNRGGDRQANHALFRIAMVRARSDARTKAYVERRVAEGRTKGEIFRCLKRYIAREVFKYLPRDLRA
jgi:transposase